MLRCTMCRHGFSFESKYRAEEGTEDDEPDQPSFLNEASDVESELLTDGGDE